MKILLILWTLVRNAFEAIVWATAVWTLLYSFYTIQWIYLFWIFFIILHFIGGRVIGAEPSLIPAFLVIDLGLVALAIWQAVATSLIPTILAILVLKWVSHWTQQEPDWLHVFLFFACTFYILWRRNGKHRSIRAWKGTPRATPKPSGLITVASNVEHLPEWQRETLSEHWRQRALQVAKPDQIVWTRDLKGHSVTDLELYWGSVWAQADGKITADVYSKDHGAPIKLWNDFETEQEAKNAVEAFMRYGKDPNGTDCVRTGNG